MSDTQIILVDVSETLSVVEVGGGDFDQINSTAVEIIVEAAVTDTLVISETEVIIIENAAQGPMGPQGAPGEVLPLEELVPYIGPAVAALIGNDTDFVTTYQLAT